MDTVATTTTFRDLPIGVLLESDWNPRRHQHDADLADLAQSIKQNGVLEPILVRPKGKKFEIIAGSRRFRGSRLAGRESVPAIVRDLDDVAALEVAITENLQRHDMHPLDEAAAFQRLMEADTVYTLEVVAAKVGKSKKTVRDRLRLLTLHPLAQEAFLADLLTTAHAQELALLPIDKQVDAMEDAFHWSRGNVTTLIREKQWDELRPALMAFGEFKREIRNSLKVDLADEAVQESLLEQLPEADRPAVAPVVASLPQLSRLRWMSPAQEKEFAGVLLFEKGWYAADQTRCDHTTRGVIVHGGDLALVEACITPTCTVHFPARQAPARSSASRETASPKKTKADREEAKQRTAKAEADRKAWEALRRPAQGALVQHLATMKLDAAMVRRISESAGLWLQSVEKHFGVKLTDKNALVVLALAAIEANSDLVTSRESFEYAVKSWKFDLAKFERQFLKSQAKAKPAKKAAKTKGGK